MKTSTLTLSASCALALIVASPARAAQVSENEAVALAEWWYANEISAKTTKLSLAEKEERLAGKGRHHVQYVLGRDNLQHSRKANEDVVAYVVTFEPSGFVVVAGDDALQPVLAFNGTGVFRWNSPKKSYLSHFVGRSVVGMVEHHRTQRRGQTSSVHPNWARVSDRLKFVSNGSNSTAPQSSSASDAAASDIYVLLPTAAWDQGDHYNEVCVSNNGSVEVVTGCVATAMAIKFRYHEWPGVGNDSRSYRDNDGNVQFSHSVDFGRHSYDWSVMPTTNLTSDNADVANLMYDCGVAVKMDYERSANGGSGANPDPDDINNYFRYRGTIRQMADSVFTSLSGMKSAVSYSIRCGLPTLIGTSDHCLVACGYRETMAPYFYLNCGWGGSSDDGWYNLENITADSGLGPIEAAWPYSSPDNYAYVDGESTVQEELINGDLNTPYTTLAEGQSGVTDGGVLMIKEGHYVGTTNVITLNKAMTIKSYLGTAVIGN